jgi:hypothetical protein
MARKFPGINLVIDGQSINTLEGLKTVLETLNAVPTMDERGCIAHAGMLRGEAFAVIVRRDERGYIPTAFRLPDDDNEARALLEKLNDDLGFDAEHVREIVLSSMFPKTGMEPG